MKLSAVVTPAALLVAGSFSTGAGATAVVDDTDYSPPFLGQVDITLAGASSPQFSFGNNPIAKFYIQGNDGATIAFPGSTSYSSSVQTNNYLFGTDGDYGIRFSANGVNYAGFATLIDDGTVIDKITYDVAGVPEPATWAMMVVGLGLAGAAMRRKRRRQDALVRA